MKTRYMLTLEDVQTILAAARARAEAHGWAVTIAVTDDGGHLLGLLRLDGASPSTAYMAPEKARTAALGRKESRLYEESINRGRMSMLSAPVLQGMVEGGLPVVVDGEVIGAVGVSGVNPSDDLQVAHSGVEALRSSCDFLGL